MKPGFEGIAIGDGGTVVVRVMVIHTTSVADVEFVVLGGAEGGTFV